VAPALVPGGQRLRRRGGGQRARGGRTWPAAGAAWSRVRLGAAAGAPVAVAFALAPATPARRLLRDKRVAGLSGRQLACHVLLRIPVGTVRWEEVAFRAVLPAALHRVLPRPAAIAVVSALFGAWHIRPTADALRENQLAAGRTAWVAAVAAAPTPRPSGRTSPRSPAGQSPRPWSSDFHNVLSDLRRCRLCTCTYAADVCPTRLGARIVHVHKSATGCDPERERRVCGPYTRRREARSNSRSLSQFVTDGSAFRLRRVVSLSCVCACASARVGAHTRVGRDNGTITERNG
jgi:Type II CAAX prenyl endopeptidase Rce1-like